MKSQIASFLVLLTLGVAAQADTLKIDPVHSTVGFKIRHMFGNVTGRFTDVSGTIDVDAAHPENATVQATIGIKSIDTANAMRDNDLRGSNFFEAEKFPTMTFKSTKVVVNGQQADLTGDLTLHGVTKPITLKARLIGSGNDPILKAFAVGFEATGDINRSDFGIKQYLPLVGDDVRLTIAGAFLLQP